MTSVPTRVRSFYLERLPAALIAAGAVLRIEQWLHRRSLWLDEASLASSLVHLPFARLADPLPINQGAPVGFLAVERGAVAAFGNNEYALRLFPLACGIGALLLFLALSRRILRPGSVPIAIALFAFWPGLVYYSTEVKQYGVDVFVALAILVVAVRLRGADRIPTRSAMGFAALGAAAVWLSHPAVFVFAGVGAVLGVKRAARRQVRDVTLVAAACSIAAASFVASYVISLRDLGNNSVLLNYWRAGFPPRPSSVATTARWLAGRVADLLRDPVGIRATVLGAVLLAAGAGAMALRGRITRLALLIAPAAVLLVAALLRKYPARGRLALFLVPAIILLLAAALELPETLRLRGASVLVLGALAVAVAGPIRSSLVQYARPLERNESREVLEFVRDSRKPGDAVYLHHGANAAYRYYGPIIGLRADRVVDDSTATPCDDRSALGGVRAASRVWLVFSHRFDGAPANEEAIYASHFEVVARPVSVFRAPGAAAYLFATDRPSDPSAERVLTDPRLTCLTITPA